MSTTLLIAARQQFHGAGAPPVEPPAVATVTISGATSVAEGSTILLTATVRDANGNILTGRVVSWSSDSVHATVNGAGAVTGVTAGTANITATCEGEPSTPFAITVTPAAPSPLTAGTATATPGDGKVTISWTAPTGGTAPYTFDLYRSPTAGVLGDPLATGVTSPYVDAPLTNGTPESYTVRATDAVGASVDYTQKTATPAATTITLTPVVAPSNLVMPADGYARVGIDLARVKASGALDNPPWEDMSTHSVEVTVSDPAVVTAALDTASGITNRAMLLTARGVGSATVTVTYDGGAYSASMSVVVDDTTPGAVAGLVAGTVSGLNLALTWSAWTDPDGDFDHFAAFYETDGTDPTTASRCVMVSRGDSTATSGTARLGEPSTPHKIALAAVDKAGHIGALSNVVSATTGAREAYSEPAGFTVIYDNPGTDPLPGFTADQFVLNVADPDAPSGSALEFRWWSDNLDGNLNWDDHPGAAHLWSKVNNSPLTDPSTQVYFRLVIRHNKDWIHHPGGDKLSYFGQGNKSSASFAYLRNKGGKDTQAPWGLGYQNQANNLGSSKSSLVDGGDGFFYPGAYHAIEFLIVAQSGTVGADGKYIGDGEFYVWIDGVQRIASTGKQWVTTGEYRFQRFEFYPYWGGDNEDKDGTATPPYLRFYKHAIGPYLRAGTYDWLRFGEFYMSAKP